MTLALLQERRYEQSGDEAEYTAAIASLAEMAKLRPGGSAHRPDSRPPRSDASRQASVFASGRPRRQARDSRRCQRSHCYRIHASELRVRAAS